MKNYFNILVATDYSEASSNATRYAIKLAKDTNSILTFLHVYGLSETYPKEFAKLEHVDYSPLDYEIQRLEKHVSELFEAMNIKAGEKDYKCVVAKGNAGKKINDTIADLAADFVIVGTHGQSILKKVFLGSHTWDLIKTANIPVLAVPAEAKYVPVQNIVFATEYREGELPAIKFLTNIAAQFDAGVTVVHITDDVFSREFEQDIFARFKEEVKAKVNYDKLDMQLLHKNSLVKGLNSFCIRSKSNWLVMSPEKKLLFEKVFNPIASRTKQMSFYTHVPLFTIPDYYSPKGKVFWKEAKKKFNLSKDFPA